MSRYFILKDDRPKESTFPEWARQPKSDREIAETTIDGVQIKTVFTGVAEYFNGGEPLLFKTMVIGGKNDGYERHHISKDQAIRRHEEIAKQVREQVQL